MRQGIIGAALCGGLSLQVLAADGELAAASAPETETVVVNGQRSAPYTAQSAVSSGSKSDVPLLDTPMAVQVVSAQLIEDRALQTVADAIKNVSGVQSAGYQFYDFYQIRGFTAGYGNGYRNGLQMQGINGAESVAFIEQVEIVKGPASMLYGRIDPGGLVNVVTKKPERAAAYSLAQQLGRWGALRSTVDATGPLAGNDQLQYRLIGDYDHASSWVDYTHHDKRAGAASLAWQPSSDFQANLQLEYYRNKLTWPEASIPVIGDHPADLPRSFSKVFPVSWSDYPYTAQRYLIAYDWNYALGEGWKLVNRFHILNSKEDQQGVYAGDFDGVDSFTSVRFTHTGPNWRRRQINTNLDLSGHFATGLLRHDLLLGLDWARFKDDSDGSTGNIDGAAPLNIHQPVYPDYRDALAALVAQDAGNIIWRDRSRDYGVYLQDQLAYGEHWRVLLGGRYDWAQDAYASDYGSRDAGCYPNCSGYPIVAYPVDQAFSPRAGVLYKLDAQTSAYSSYAKSFGLSNGRNADGGALPPEQGLQYELGVKRSALDGSLSASLSLFDLSKKNVAQFDPNTFASFVVGRIRSRGLELDVAGQLTHSLSLVASYTLDQAVITHDPVSGNQGHRFSGVAPSLANFWAQYDSAPDTPQAWTLGLGGYFSAHREGDDENTWRLPGYARLDAAASLRWRLGLARASLQLNVENLSDRRYFESGAYGFAAYGAPRNVRGTLKLEL